MATHSRASIIMSPSEIDEFLHQQRTATLGTVGLDGTPHLVAMWYGLVGGKIYLETKVKSQKAVNLLRNPRVSISVENGLTYDQLRGVSVEGTAVVIDDPEHPEYWPAAVSVFERYQAPYTEEARPIVEAMMNKRVVVRIEPVRVRSWDHRKLGWDPLPVTGTTAEFAGR